MEKYDKFMSENANKDNLVIKRPVVSGPFLQRPSKLFFLDKLMKLVGGESVINRTDPV